MSREAELERQVALWKGSALRWREQVSVERRAYRRLLADYRAGAFHAD